MRIDPKISVAQLAITELFRINHLYIAISDAKREWPEALTIAAQAVEDELLRDPIDWAELRLALINANMQKGYAIEGFSSTAYGALLGILDPKSWSLRETFDHGDMKRSVAAATVKDRDSSVALRNGYNVEDMRYCVAFHIRTEELRREQQ